MVLSEQKRTLVFGASPNPARYSHIATIRLAEKGIETIPVGRRRGTIGDLDIITAFPQVEDLHTITLYIGPDHQPEYYEYFLQLNPKRIIFNPGTENPELAQLAEEKGIEALEACTLVMLSIDKY